jgi:hypothetical protein
VSDDRPAVDETAQAPSPKRQTLWLKIASIVVSLAVVSLSLRTPGGLEQLLLGWLYLLLRVSPQMTADRPTLVLGAAALMGLVVVLRRMLTFLAASRNWPDTRRRHWTSWNTSVRLTVVLILLFVSGTAIVGLAHQSIWLATDRDSDHADSHPGSEVFSLANNSRGRESLIRNHLHELTLATMNFQDVYDAVPIGGTLTADGRPLHSWITYLGPYLSFDNSEVDFSQPFNAPPNERLFRCGLREVVIPGVSPEFDAWGYGLSHVAANARLFPVVATDNPSRDTHAGVRLYDIGDGASQTLLFGEAAGDFTPWGSPWNIRDPELGLNTGSNSFGTPSPRDYSFHVMADGSVREFSHHMDHEVFQRIGTPTRGEEF